MFDDVEFSFKAKPLSIKAHPVITLIPIVIIAIGLIWGTASAVERAGGQEWIPVVGGSDDEVREVFTTPTSTPIQVITEGPPTPEPVTPTPQVAVASLAPESITVEAPTLTSTVTVEAVDLDPILAAIESLNLEVVQEEVDIEAILAAIEAGFSDIVIEITVDGTTEIVCDTRGQGCEEPPFGNRD